MTEFTEFTKLTELGFGKTDMGLPIFEIEIGFEAKVATFLSGHGYAFLPTRKRVEPEGPHPGIEQCWSIQSGGKEIATLTIIDTNEGRKILAWGSLRDRSHKEIYRSLNDEALKLGTKPLDDFSSAFAPIERTKN